MGGEPPPSSSSIFWQLRGRLLGYKKWGGLGFWGGWNPLQQTLAAAGKFRVNIIWGGFFLGGWTLPPLQHSLAACGRNGPLGTRPAGMLFEYVRRAFQRDGQSWTNNYMINSSYCSLGSLITGIGSQRNYYLSAVTLCREPRAPPDEPRREKRALSRVRVCDGGPIYYRLLRQFLQAPPVHLKTWTSRAAAALVEWSGGGRSGRWKA